MRLQILLFSGLTLLFLSACNSLKTDYTYDQQTDFSQYRTFRIADFSKEGKFSRLNAMNQQRFETATAAELEKRGLKQTDDKPDLLVNIHVINEVKVGEQDDSASYPYGKNPIYQDTTPKTYTYNKGAVIIDLVDAESNELVWQGVAQQLIDEDPKMKNPEKIIPEVVAKVMANYPPR